jgi:hypothetical protein
MSGEASRPACGCQVWRRSTKKRASAQEREEAIRAMSLAQPVCLGPPQAIETSGPPLCPASASQEVLRAIPLPWGCSRQDPRRCPCSLLPPMRSEFYWTYLAGVRIGLRRKIGKHQRWPGKMLLDLIGATPSGPRPPKRPHPLAQEAVSSSAKESSHSGNRERASRRSSNPIKSDMVVVWFFFFVLGLHIL